MDKVIPEPSIKSKYAYKAIISVPKLVPVTVIRVFSTGDTRDLLIAVRVIALESFIVMDIGRLINPL